MTRTIESRAYSIAAAAFPKDQRMELGVRSLIIDALRAVAAEAVAAERERAAGIADAIDPAGRSAWKVAVDIAAAIRAGG